MANFVERLDYYSLYAVISCKITLWLFVHDYPWLHSRNKLSVMINNMPFVNRFELLRDPEHIKKDT